MDFKEERKFGLIVSVFISLVFVVKYFRTGTYSTALIVIICAILSISFFSPAILRPLLKIWLKIGHILGLINSKIILCVVFFLVVTPIAMFTKIVLRKDPLKLGKSSSNSFWQKIKNGDDEISSNYFKRQF